MLLTDEFCNLPMNIRIQLSWSHIWTIQNPVIQWVHPIGALPQLFGHCEQQSRQLHGSQSLVIALIELKFQGDHCCLGLSWNLTGPAEQAQQTRQLPDQYFRRIFMSYYYSNRGSRFRLQGWYWCVRALHNWRYLEPASLSQKPESMKSSSVCRASLPVSISSLKSACQVGRLLLIMPATNATSECSFSVLRRFKSYLQSTMSQPRLNHVMVLSTYKELLDELDLYAIANEFVGSSEYRLRPFGTFTAW